MTNSKTLRKMSDTMIACELRAAWEEVASGTRCGISQPRKSLTDYIVALTGEQKRRAA